jgi:hypothetical protein
MRQPRSERVPDGRPTKARSGLWGARACLIGGVIVYLGLAALAIRWRPDQPFIASIWIFLAAHSAAYLVFQEVRGSGDTRES